LQYQKVKSVAKVVKVRGEKLDDLVLNTLKTCADAVGSTLGPGGMSVVIERQEIGMAPMITKDGVTVFKALGFQDPTAQVLMEATRDASVRTANEAGDGTTTATILSYSLTKTTKQFCKDHPKYSPQRVMRVLSETFEKDTLPWIAATATPVNADPKSLEYVARVSANGDVDLGKAVMECFNLVGDEGNVTITEESGPSSYKVEKIEGYPVMTGYEDSCKLFYPKFITEPGVQSIRYENPVFVLYNGAINDYNILSSFCERVGQDPKTNRIVLVATSYSDQVLALLAMGAADPVVDLKVFPLAIPKSPIATGQLDFLQDMAALTGGTIMDPINNPLATAAADNVGKGPTMFECTRWRSNIIGHLDPELIEERVNEIEQQVMSAGSELDKTLARERIAKMTSGIAKLRVLGSSNGEIKERRDRAEDAVCAVRGAIKHGVLPGGGWTLAHLAHRYGQATDDSFVSVVKREILAKALIAPVETLYTNAGFDGDQTHDAINNLASGSKTFDILEGKWVDGVTGGLLDSVPAVRDALKNAMSIAGVMGTCGATIVFGRDEHLERSEASNTAEFLRNANSEVDYY